MVLGSAIRRLKTQGLKAKLVIAKRIKAQKQKALEQKAVELKQIEALEKKIRSAQKINLTKDQQSIISRQLETKKLKSAVKRKIVLSRIKKLQGLDVSLGRLFEEPKKKRVSRKKKPMKKKVTRKKPVKKRKR